MGDYNRLSQSRDSSEEDEAFVQKEPVLDHGASRPRHAWLSIFVVSFFAFILGILSTLLFSYLHGTSSGIQSDGQKVLVQLPDEVVHFYENKTFMEDSSEKSDALWQSLIPGRGEANGMMAIKNPEQYGIEEGLMIGPNTYKYGVSMFHSLHCLITVREVLFGLLQGKFNASDYGREDENGDPTYLTQRVRGHTTHFLDYIRQEIQCCGDMTPEPPPRGLEDTILGTGGTPHLNCKSYTAAFKFMEVNQQAFERPENMAYDETVPGKVPVGKGN